MQWQYRIWLDGVDVTSRIVLGSESVDLAANDSCLMDCSYRPESGVQDPDGPIFDTLVLDLDLGSGWVTIYSGTVIRADWQPKDRIYRLRASTRMQEHFRAMADHAAVLAAITGATYSAAVFGEAADDFWSYAEAAMSTTEADWWIGTGGTLETAAWEPSAMADVALTAADVDGAAGFTYTRADAESQTNQVVLELDYQVQRKKIRSHTLSWEGPTTDLCDWWEGIGDYGQWAMPWTSDLEPMKSASSWDVPAGLATEGPVPESGRTVIDGDDQEENASYTFSWRDDCGHDADAFLTFRGIGTSWPVWAAVSVGYQAITGEVTDQYRITLSADAHIAATSNTVTVRRSGAYAAPKSEWPIGPAGPTAWATDTVGDAYEDDEDETERANMLACGYAWGKARIREAMRANDLTVTMRLRTDLTLASSVSVDAWGVTTGPLRVRSLRYTMAPPRIVATLAVRRGQGGTDDAWSTPARPDSTDPVGYWEAVHADDDPPYAYPDVSASTTLQTHVGLVTGCDPAPDPDERTGWITNCQKGAVYDVDGEEYQQHFAVEWPGIEEEAASGMEIESVLAYEIGNDNDSLTITA
jgi:hypothetical protein